MPVSFARLSVRRIGFPVLNLFVAVAFLAGLAGCQRGKPQAEAPAPVEVTIIEATATTAPLAVDGIGHVNALSTISIRPQVTGVLKQTLFAEGEVVKAGQPLLVIDPSFYKAQLDQAVSTLARDRASAEYAKRDWQRYKDLVAQAVVSQDDYEQKRSTYQQAAEQVRVDEAAVATAKVNLGYCYINAPVPGVAGLQQFKTGNLVTANQDVVVTVNQIEPVNVQFSVAEKYLPDIRAHAAKGALRVEARYPGREEAAGVGKLTVINNTVDPTTGMITLQGEFPNHDRALWPGQYVDASVILTETANTILVPSNALVTTQDGSSVFTVKPDNTVEVRPVTVGRKIGPNTVVEKGVNVGDKIITSGQIKLFPGVPVKIVDAQTYKEGPVPPAAVTSKTGQEGKASGEGQGK